MISGSTRGAFVRDCLKMVVCDRLDILVTVYNQLQDWEDGEDVQYATGSIESKKII